MRDGRGPFLAVGASMFAAAALYRTDRARLERILRWLAVNGVDYIRALACVGRPTFWEGREVDPKAPGWRDDIAGTTALALTCGLRVQWTLFGDADQMVPALSDRQRVVDTVADICTRNPGAIIALEAANESWQNGFAGASGIAQLRDLTNRLQDRTGGWFPIAVSCPSGANEHEQQENATALYAGSAATFLTGHYERALGEDSCRPIRQPYQVRSYTGVPKAASNNEPIGIDVPGGSNPTDSDTDRQIAGAVVSWLVGHWGHVLHDRSAGTRIDRDWSDVKNIGSILEGLTALRKLLPADLPNWSVANDHWTDYPFRHDVVTNPDGKRCGVAKWVDGHAEGPSRAYAAYSGNRFVIPAIGIRGSATFTARGTTAVRAFTMTGEPIEAKTLAAGSRWRIGGRQNLLVIGEQR